MFTLDQLPLLLLLRKNSSSAVQKCHSKVYGNPIAPSFYSIISLIKDIASLNLRKFYAFVGWPKIETNVVFSYGLLASIYRLYPIPWNILDIIWKLQLLAIFDTKEMRNFITNSAIFHQTILTSNKWLNKFLNTNQLTN